MPDLWITLFAIDGVLLVVLCWMVFSGWWAHGDHPCYRKMKEKQDA